MVVITIAGFEWCGGWLWVPLQGGGGGWSLWPVADFVQWGWAVVGVVAG